MHLTHQGVIRLTRLGIRRVDFADTSARLRVSELSMNPSERALMHFVSCSVVFSSSTQPDV